MSQMPHDLASLAGGPLSAWPAQGLWNVGMWSAPSENLIGRAGTSYESLYWYAVY